MKKLFLGLILIFLCQSYVSADMSVPSKKIEINLPANTLSLYDGNKLVKEYPVCVGKPSTPSKTGNFHIVYKSINPYWYYDGEVVEPGPDNPLGVRWMGISQSIGIHGNNNAASIGTFASSGCIRMYNNDVIELYNLVPINTPVTIKYQRIKVVDDKYSGKRAVLIYPNKYRLNLDRISGMGIPDSLIDKVRKTLKQDLKSVVSVSPGVSVFLNNQFITNDAFEEADRLYINNLAAIEVFGVSPEFVDRYSISIQESNNTVYLCLNDIIEHQNGKMTYNHETRNAYINLELLKINGIFLSDFCGNFDKDYLIETSGINKLGLETKEDQYSIHWIDQKIPKVINDGKSYISIDELAKNMKYKINVNSFLKTIDIKIPAILTFQGKSYNTFFVEDRLVLDAKASESLGRETATVFNENSVQYVDLEELLQNYSYKTNEFCTIIKVQEKENQ